MYIAFALSVLYKPRLGRAGHFVIECLPSILETMGSDRKKYVEIIFRFYIFFFRAGSLCHHVYLEIRGQIDALFPTRGSWHVSRQQTRQQAPLPAEPSRCL